MSEKGLLSLETECCRVDSTSLTLDGSIYSIIPLHPFYLLLPYLWSDMKFYGTEKGAYKLKPIGDVLNEARDARKPPLQPINQELKEALHENPILLEAIKKVCVGQNGT